MDEELDIIVTGFDVDARLAEAGLVRVFGVDAQRARRFVSELPVVAKRCGSAAVAERYVNALRSIGARIEVQKVAELEAGERTTALGSHSSLPIPAPSVPATLGEAARIARETERAIRRFRLDEGLDQPPSESEPPEVDPANPAIPRAPRVPHDLHRMPNVALPRYSDRPDWILTDPLSQAAEAQAGDSGVRAHADARLPPPPSSVPPPLRNGDGGVVDAEAALEERAPGSIRPSAVGLAHAATASVRPGLGLFSSWPFWQKAPAVERRLRAYWPAVLALVLLVYAGLRLLSGFESPQDRRERGWRRHGIEPGENAAAERWLEAENHAIDGLSRAAARELVQRLIRAGALGVYAVRIRPTAGGQAAAGLVVELPDDAAGRRTISWHAARALGRKKLLHDHGEPYYELTFR